MQKKDCDNCVHMVHKPTKFGYLYVCEKAECEPKPKKRGKE